MIVSLISIIKSCKISTDMLKKIWFIICLVLLCFFYSQAKYYKSLAKRLEMEERMEKNKIGQMYEFNKVIDNYLRESLDEDFFISSNDIFQLRRSIGLSNYETTNTLLSK